jgi:CHAD domain-containing protein
MVKEAEACGVTGEHLEQEVKLDVWPGFRLPELVGLPSGAAAAPATTSELVAIYHDTPDLRLARAGISLRHRSGDGTGWTLKLPSAVAAAAGAVSRTETTFAGGPQEVPPEVLARLSAWTRNALLVPVAHLETLRRTIVVTGGEDGRQVAEVVDDEVSALHDGQLALRFRELEVEVEPDAPDGLLAAVVDRLVEAGARPGGHRSKVARVLGPRADEPGDLAVPELGKHPSVSDVLRAGIARSVTLIVTHDAGARAGIDPEAVHQARVGTRRLRSDLRTYRSLLLPAWAAALREELGWLAAALGGVRDADVLLERLERRVRDLPEEDRAAGAVLVDRLRAHRTEARRDLLDVLDDQRYLDLLDRLVDAVRHPAVVEAAARPAAKVLPGLAARPWRHLRQAVEALGDDPADEQLHEVRIRAKRARYAAEVAALVAGERARRFAKAVAGVQGVLGDLQDASVSEAWLRAAVADVDPAAAAVALRLAGEDRADADRARASWMAAWEPLTGKRLRSWLSR